LSLSILIRFLERLRDYFDRDFFNNPAQPVMSKPQPAVGNFPRPADESEVPDPGEAIATPREKPGARIVSGRRRTACVSPIKISSECRFHPEAHPDRPRFPA
jgi:hypothetical protein